MPQDIRSFFGGKGTQEVTSSQEKAKVSKDTRLADACVSAMGLLTNSVTRYDLMLSEPVSSPLKSFPVSIHTKILRISCS